MLSMLEERLYQFILYFLICYVNQPHQMVVFKKKKVSAEEGLEIV